MLLDSDDDDFWDGEDLDTWQAKWERGARY